MNCSEKMDMLNGLPLAKAYIPFQKFTEPFSPEDALAHGTAWRELADKEWKS